MTVIRSVNVASKSTKPSLYNKAIHIVNQEEKQEIQEKIHQKYQQLLYKSQMQRVDQKTILKIRKIAQHLPSAHSMGVAAHSMGVAALNHTIRGVLDDYIQKKKYHPTTLKEIERYTKTREWPKSMLTEV